MPRVAKITLDNMAILAKVVHVPLPVLLTYQERPKNKKNG